MENILDSNLRIGDVVWQLRYDGTPYNEPFNDLTVINKTDSEITFFRPYVSLANFTYTGGVIPYIGISQFNVPIRGVEYLLRNNIYHERT
jgi:hypothetical protein